MIVLKIFLWFVAYIVLANILNLIGFKMFIKNQEKYMETHEEASTLSIVLAWLLKDHTFKIAAVILFIVFIISKFL